MLSLLHKLQSDFYLLYLYLCVRAPTRACMCVCWVLICVVTFKTFLLILTHTIINNDVCKVHVLDGKMGRNVFIFRIAAKLNVEMFPYRAIFVTVKCKKKSSHHSLTEVGYVYG